MFSSRKPAATFDTGRPTSNHQTRALMERMRALGENDQEVARLLDELEQHLPEKARPEAAGRAVEAPGCADQR